MENVMKEEKQPNLILAILLSFLMGLVGSILFIVLYYLGIIAWLAGIVIVIAAGWGYKKFNLKMDTKGYIIVSVISVIDIIIALLVGISFAVSVEVGVPFSQGFVLFMQVAAEDSTVKSALIYDIILSLVCIGIGIGIFIGSEKHKEKSEKSRLEAEEKLKNLESFNNENNNYESSQSQTDYNKIDALSNIQDAEDEELEDIDEDDDDDDESERDLERE